MQNRVKRLRVWLLGSGVFLMLVIAAFILSARYLSHHRLTLASGLGVNIVRETNGYTYSQSVQGKTVYTIHAAKAVEHMDGKIALHDVSIVLYGRNHDRNDRIYGSEFEYDQKAGVVRAMGLVHIDVQAGGEAGKHPGGAFRNPADAADGLAKGASRAPREVARDAKVMHVTTSGLVYIEKLGVAATGEYIEFQVGAISGHATGADYNADTGLLMLHTAVGISGMVGGRPVVLTASTADLDNRNQQTFLTHAKYVAEGQTVEAENATVHTRPDGTLARVEAQGNVAMEADDTTLVSQRADVVLNPASQPESAVLTGGVLYTSVEPLRQVRGKANEATIVFDGQAKPQPQHAVFSGAVDITERMRATEAVREPWSTRDLTAAKVEATLVATDTGRSQLRDAEAVGNAHLAVVNNGRLETARGEGQTELSADDLKAHLVAGRDADRSPRLDTIQGRGHTVLRQLSVDGIEQTSSGDRLDATFLTIVPGTQARRTIAGRSANAAASSHGELQDTGDLASADQQGHVVMTRRVPARVGATAGAKAAGQANAHDDVEHAIAERAVYDGDLNRVTLTGGVQLRDAQDVLWANQVALDRRTGDTHAEGAVKVNYAQDGPSPGSAATGSAQATVLNPARSGRRPQQVAEPTHIVADRADLDHSTYIATFYGKPVRLWQGGSQVQAPVIELSRAHKRMIARGEASTGWSTAAQAAQVHTVLVRSESDKAAAATSGTVKAPPGLPGCESPAALRVGATNALAASPTTDVVRIASGGLIFSGVLGQADFTGGVRADTVDATIRAGEATAYLQQAAGPDRIATPAPSNAEGRETTGSGMAAYPSLAGNVQRLVAIGHVEIDKPGLRATGERLVYTSSDRVFVLTGDGNAPPKAVDARGTTTGAALRFQSCEASVVVFDVVPGADGSSSGKRVRTDLQVSKDARTGKVKR